MPPLHDTDAADERATAAPRGEVEGVVEKRVDAASGRVLYLVKWAGFDAEDNTWEAAEDLKDAEDLLRDFEQARAAAAPLAVTSQGGSNHARKRLPPSSDDDEDDEAGDDSEDDAKIDFTTSADMSKPVNAKWEGKITSIRAHSKAKDGVLFRVLWGDGHKSYVHSTWLSQRAPLTVLKYYESVIMFTPSQ